MNHFLKNKLIVFRFFYFSLVLSPILILWLYPNQSVAIDSSLFNESIVNTGFLTLAVLVVSTILGLSLALVRSFFDFPLREKIHIFLMLPLAMPAYILAFVYLSIFGSGSEWEFFEIQGQLWFLSIVLIFSLMPYTYFFCCLGLKSLCQTELETEILLKAGSVSFFRYVIFPKVAPFLLSAQILVIFETLADFGAASMVNVPVMTTMIYKAWFDLFSFSGAVSLSLKYSLVIALILFLEFFFKRNNEGERKLETTPLRTIRLGSLFGLCFYPLVFIYIFMSVLLPVFQISRWALIDFNNKLAVEVLQSFMTTFGLGMGVALITVVMALIMSLIIRSFGEKIENWTLISTVGYSFPGTILAVAVYGILLLFVSSVSASLLFMALVLALSYKFFTVSFRPIAEATSNIAPELDETSVILKVSYLKRFKTYIFPHCRDSLIIGGLLVMIEVMKEMPLTLMLAPSEYQTLSIKIFNFTSEGEWSKASLPSLCLVVIGVFSVYFVQRREKMG